VPAGAGGDPGRKLREVGAGLDLALRSGLKAASAVSLQLSTFNFQLSAFIFTLRAGFSGKSRCLQRIRESKVHGRF
jgi:hypothetical protein